MTPQELVQQLIAMRGQTPTIPSANGTQLAGPSPTAGVQIPDMSQMPIPGAANRISPPSTAAPLPSRQGASSAALMDAPTMQPRAAPPSQLDQLQAILQAKMNPAPQNPWLGALTGMAQGAGAKPGMEGAQVQDAQKIQMAARQQSIQNIAAQIKAIQDQKQVEQDQGLKQQQNARLQAESDRSAQAFPLEQDIRTSTIEQGKAIIAKANAPAFESVPPGHDYGYWDTHDPKNPQFIKLGTSSFKQKTPKSLQSKEVTLKDGTRMMANFDPGKGTYSDSKGNDISDKVTGEYHQPPAEPTAITLVDDPKHPGQQIPVVVNRTDSTGTPITIAGQEATKTPQSQLNATAKTAVDLKQTQSSYKALQELAVLRTYAADQAMADQYFNIIKPGSGARMNEANIKRLLTPGPLADKLTVWAQRLDQGQPLDDAARKAMIDAAKAVLDAKAAPEPAPAAGGWKILP